MRMFFLAFFLATSCALLVQRHLGCPGDCAVSVAYELDGYPAETAARAAEIWNRGTERRLCVAPGNGTVIRYADLPRNDGYYTGFPPARGEILIRRGLPPERELDVLVHEMGHAAGLSHSASEQSIMHPSTGALEDGGLPMFDRIEWCRKFGCRCAP